jgi:methylenetetrahydrofolate dehydrogenase (NADP+)/methenyltetrahydrofolate cyclohydrolase
MSAKILYGKEYADKIKAEAKNYIDTFNANVGLAVVIVGNDPASQVYVRNKTKVCDEVGIKNKTIVLPEESTKETVITEINALNENNDVTGILVQLPLPSHLKEFEQEILDTIIPQKDVDGFLPINVGKVDIGDFEIAPCTPSGIVKMLEMENVDFEGKNAVVIGRSNIVGKPMAQLLLQKNCTVTICHSRTKNLKCFTKNADIVVVAVGKPNFLTDDMIQKGAIVVDVGINRVNGKLVGDVNFETVKEKAGMITPVPKGVGVLTTAMLAYNVVSLHKTCADIK